jgi:hypothetical protein
MPKLLLRILTTLLLSLALAPLPPSPSHTSQPTIEDILAARRRAGLREMCEIDNKDITIFQCKRVITQLKGSLVELDITRGFGFPTSIGASYRQRRIGIERALANDYAVMKILSDRKLDNLVPPPRRLP